ncbi:MAG: Ig-like domain-containing protein, partial [Actinomycetota bacterium]
MINAFRRTTAFLASATVALSVGPFGGIAFATPALTNDDPIPLLPLPSLPLPAAPNAVDTTPPETSILSGPSNPSNDTTPSFTMGTDEPGTFECSVDGSPFFACSNPYEITPALADGNHTFEARAIDASANVDPTPASYAWVVDTVAPDSTIDSGPTNPTSDVTPEFQFSSTDPSATFECRLSPSEGWGTCTSPQGRGPLADGTYEFQVRATDAAGNTQASIATHPFRVDTTGPVVTIDSAPADPSGNANPSFSFSTTDASTPVSFSCVLDGGAAFACTSPTTVGPLAEGSHTFAVTGTDSLGNTGSAASYTWTVDLSGPDTTITSAPSSPTNQTSASFNFTSPEAGATFECSLDGSAFGACTSPQSYSGLAAGSHDFLVRALDALGNPDPSPASHTWTIDLTAPDTTITANPGPATNDSTPTFEFTSNEPGSTFQCSRNTGQPYVSCTSPYTLNPAYADGSKVFRVRAIDPAGNVDASPASYSFVVDTVAPTASFTATPASPTNADPVSHSFTRADERSGVATVECAVDGGAFAACASPVTFGGLADGSHTVFVRVTDNASNQTTIQNTFTVDRT